MKPKPYSLLFFLTPVFTLHSAATVTNIAAGYSHSLFIKSDASLWAMGRNAEGELGDGTTTNRTSPIQIVAGGVVAVAAGGNFSLFLKSDGSLWGMGDNSYGQLGLGGINHTNVPTQIVAPSAPALSHIGHWFVRGQSRHPRLQWGGGQDLLHINEHECGSIV